MKNILFLTFVTITNGDGISNKILSQVKSLRFLGNNVHLGYLKKDKQNVTYWIDDKQIATYANSTIGKMRLLNSVFKKILKYAIKNHIDVVYFRYFLFAYPHLIKLFSQLRKLKIKTIIEIPTYPYDKERINNSPITIIKRGIDKYYRRKLHLYIDRIVTFSLDTKIWGVQTIRISNGVSYDTIPIKEPSDINKEFHMIGVAILAPWHGFDRVLRSIQEQKNKIPQKIIFHIVGSDPTEVNLKKLKQLVTDLKIEENVIFHGKMHGSELDEVFNISHIAIGSLGRHRNGIETMRSLKNVEYTSRGIPFVYSENNPDFDGKPFVYKVSPDESMIDLSKIIEFYKTLQLSPIDIHQNASIYSWDNQMKKVNNFINSNL